MDEWDQPIEETGEFDQQNEEGPSSADPGWKDELNLAEFPIAALTDRIPDGQTTLVFEDRLERRDSPPIVRRLTIMGTHKHGLPTSLDDEVLVGLIQLTKRRSNFTDARVQFSRYELIELLGWPQSGQSYRRIEEALHRWVGVVLMYENAWWDNVAKSWVDEQFHVLDNVTLYDRERWRTSARSGKIVKGDRVRVQGRQAPPALVELPLERGDLPEFPERQPQAARPRVLSQAAAADDQADVSLSGQAVLPPLAAGLRPADPGLRAHRPEPFVRPDRAQAAAQAGPGGAGAARVPRAAQPRGAVLVRQARLLADHLHPRPSATAEVQDPTVRHEQQPSGADRGPQGAGSHRQDGPRAGRDALPRPDPHQDRGLRLAVAQRGQAGRQEPGRLSRGLDPIRLPGSGRLSGTGLGAKSAPRRDERPKADAQRSVQEQRQARDEVQAQRDKVREAKLRAAWERLPEAEREAILAAVKAENPGLSRWKNMLEPLCLAALEARISTRPAPGPVNGCSSPTSTLQR